jgi:hypothetical protein
MPSILKSTAAHRHPIWLYVGLNLCFVLLFAIGAGCVALIS